MKLGRRFAKHYNAVGPKNLGKHLKEVARIRLLNIQGIINDIIELKSPDTRDIFIPAQKINLCTHIDSTIIMLLQNYYEDAGWSKAAWDEERGGFRLIV